MKIKNFDKKKGLMFGYSIVDILVYLAIFTSLSVLVINSFITILSSFNTTNTNRKLLESGSIVMERVSREIRQAESIDTAHSSSSVLQLNSIDTNTGNPAIIKFAAVGGALNIYKDGALIGNLLEQDISATSLIFRRIQTINSEAVRIEMALEYSRGQNTRTENFYNTIILRGGY
jgi:hypothetical protein